MSRLGPLLVALVVSAGPVGCRKSSPSVGSDDAGVKVDAAARAGPLEARLVARTLSTFTRLLELPNGKVVLDAGIFVYALTADGEMQRLGEPAAYATFLPEGDDQLGGYDVRPTDHFVGFDRVRARADGAVVIEDDREDPPVRWAWTGAAWTKAASSADSDAGAVTARDIHDLRAPSRVTKVERFDSTMRWLIEMPAGIDEGKLARAVDGTLIVIATQGDVPVTVVAAPGSRQGVLTSIGDLATTPPTGVTCDHVPSWSTPHLLCGALEHAGSRSLHRLSKGRWERVPLDAQMAAKIEVASVGYDGVLWIGLQDGNVARLAARDVVDVFALPKLDAPLLEASYSETSELVEAPLQKPSDWPRQWVSVMIEPQGDPRRVDHVKQIVPGRGGDAWLRAGEKKVGGPSVIVHVGQHAGAAPRAPLFVGSETDQRNVLRSTRPLKAWVGHCPLLFVPIVKQHADGSFAPEAVWSREKQLGAIVKKAWGPPSKRMPHAALVEGSLAGGRVAGVLLWRSSVTESEELLEKGGSALSEHAASNSGMTPEITCTAPVLERAQLL